MDVQNHWERIYGKKAPDAVSWYRQHLEISLDLIERATPDHSSFIIDVGGGESTLVDDLLTRGYHNITILDISQTAIDVTKKRLGVAYVRQAAKAVKPGGHVIVSTFGVRGPDEVQRS